MSLFVRFSKKQLQQNCNCFAVALLIVLCSLPCRSQVSSSVRSRDKFSKNPIKPKTEISGEDAEDAVLFIRPLSADVVNIGISYSRKVSPVVVNADVRRLCAAGQWQIAGNPQISNDSVHPDRLNSFPATTGVFFRANHAAQIVANAPNLLPYLKAFQRFHRFELSFEMEPLQPYRGVSKVDNNVVGIQLSRNEGLYTFQISVHNHKENIPSLVNNGEAIDNTAVSAPETTSANRIRQESEGKNLARRSLAPRSPNVLLMVALALGVGALVGGGIYALMTRQAVP